MGKDEDERNEILKTREQIGVSLSMMDSVQRAILSNGVLNMATNIEDASLHRPGWRVSAQMMKDSAARDKLQDAYDEYNDRLVNAYKTTPPKPLMTPANAVLDEEFDDGEDCYTKYDRDLVNRYKGE